MYFSQQKLFLIICVFSVGFAVQVPAEQGLVFPEPLQSDSLLAEKRKVRFVLGFDSRRTPVDGRNLHINGVVAGITFGEKAHRLTGGYYWVGFGAPDQFINWENMLPRSTNPGYYTDTDVHFISFIYSYPIIHTYRWTLSIPIELGVGRELSRYRRTYETDPQKNGDYYFMPAQIGVYGEYRVWNWAGINVQGGYRSAVSNDAFRDKFQGAYYRYGIRLYLGRIYMELRKGHLRRVAARQNK